MSPLDKEILELIDQVNTIIVTADPARGADGAAAALAFFNYLRERGKKVQFIYPANFPRELKDLPGADQARSHLEEARLLISFSQNEVPIRKVSYSTDEANFNLILQPVRSDFDTSQISFKTTGPVIDLLVTFGFESSAKLDEFLNRYGWDTHKTPTLNFGLDLAADVAQTNVVEASNSLSHLLFKRFAAWEIVPTPSVARALLVGFATAPHAIALGGKSGGADDQTISRL